MSVIQTTVILSYGPQSLTWFDSAAKLVGEDAVIAPDVARMAGATFAMGHPFALAALSTRLERDALHAAQAALKDKCSAPPGAAQWLASGERGMSSNALFSRLSSIDAISSDYEGDRTAHPLDPGDLRRCRLMLDAVPALAARLHDAKDLSPAWSSLIDQWESLCACMDAECPDWRDRMASADKTYDLMAIILAKAD